jgi:hypothetical protein
MLEVMGEASGWLIRDDLPPEVRQELMSQFGDDSLEFLMGETPEGKRGMVMTEDSIEMLKMMLGTIISEEELGFIQKFQDYWDEVGESGGGVNTIDDVLEGFDKGGDLGE